MLPGIYLKPVFGQQNQSQIISTVRINERINLDGNLDDPAWQLAGVSNFTQRELNFGQVASERTKVVVCYDKSALWFGIWCYMKNPKNI